MNLSEKIIEWIKIEFSKMDRDTAVLGISGGKDSAVVAALLAKAIGAENVFGVMLPNGSQKDIEDSKQVIKELGINGLLVNIEPQYRESVKPAEVFQKAAGFTAEIIETTSEAAINVAPRLRMTKLYDIAQSLGALGKKACVAGTGNKSEGYVGYFTKWGDMACDFNPIKDLWLHEVLQVGDELGYFPNIIHKTPNDGLCGMADEEKLGFSYKELYDFAEGENSVSPEKSEKIKKMHKYSEHKRSPIPYYNSSK